MVLAAPPALVRAAIVSIAELRSSALLCPPAAHYFCSPGAEIDFENETFVMDSQATLELPLEGATPLVILRVRIPIGPS